MPGGSGAGISSEEEGRARTTLQVRRWKTTYQDEVGLGGEASPGGGGDQQYRDLGP